MLRRIFIQRLQGRFITYQYKNLSAGGLSLCGISSVITIPFHRQTCLLQLSLPAGYSINGNSNLQKIFCQAIIFPIAVKYTRKTPYTSQGTKIPLLFASHVFLMQSRVPEC